jgi:hypothetical protein
MIKPDDFWKLFYSQWNKPAKPIPGYTLLILAPGDLPFFLKIAMEVCATQNSEHLVETLVIPDNRLMPGFSDRLNQWAKNYAISPIRLVPQTPLEWTFTRFHKNAHNNCWMQMVRGINAVRTTHALWHDVDLFIHEPDFLKAHYETCVTKNYACLGVSKAWDSWFEERGITHLVGTWELMFDVNWVRSFSPWQHRGHDEIVNGERHTWDISFWPQYQTPPEQVGRHEKEWGFIHFNYITGNYRRFQQSSGSFEDKEFKLLLVRLLIDAYDKSGWVYEVPSAIDLAEGITDSSRRVTYVQEQTWQNYPAFRAKFQQLMDSKLLDDEKTSALATGIAPFDRRYGW